MSLTRQFCQGALGALGTERGQNELQKPVGALSGVEALVPLEERTLHSLRK